MSLKFLRLPSSPKGEIVGIMFLVWLYVTDVVLDGNTHGMALNMMRIKKYAGEKVHGILCGEKFIKVYFMWRKVHGILCREKFISCGKTYLWSMVVSPWNLNLWFLDHGISTDVLIPSIELMVLVCYGFGPWY